jgi:hypothetical protein
MQGAFEYPEDVLFLLDSVSDNFKCFMSAMNAIGADNGIEIFESRDGRTVSKRLRPFQGNQRIPRRSSAQSRDRRAIDLEKTYLPKWQVDSSKSPLDRAKRSWSEAETLSSDERVSTKDLLERLISETCAFLEQQWQDVVSKIDRLSFKEKLVRVLTLKDYFPLPTEGRRQPAHLGLPGTTRCLAATHS